jgi:hypothetical protein
MEKKTPKVGKCNLLVLFRTKYLFCCSVSSREHLFILQYSFEGDILNFKKLMLSCFWSKKPRFAVCRTVRILTHQFKGSLTRDFRLQVFFINQCPLGLWVSHWDHFEFFRKFMEIFANECLSAVSTTPAKKDKNFEIKFFKIFFKELSLVHFTPKV